MNNFLDSLSTFFKGDTTAKVTVGLDTGLLIKSGIIIMVTIVTSVFLIKILK